MTCYAGFRPEEWVQSAIWCHPLFGLFSQKTKGKISWDLGTVWPQYFAKAAVFSIGPGNFHWASISIGSPRPYLVWCCRPAQEMARRDLMRYVKIDGWTGRLMKDTFFTSASTRLMSCFWAGQQCPLEGKAVYWKCSGELVQCAVLRAWSKAVHWTLS